MTTTNDLTETDAKVLAYLKNLQKLIPNKFDNLTLYGKKATTIIKIIENPDACGNWKFDYVWEVLEAIKKIEYIYIIPYPEIEKQTEEDRVLSKLLNKNSFFSFGTNRFFGEMVTVNAVIKYMERDEIIYAWNADFVIEVQSEVKRVKKFLLS